MSGGYASRDGPAQIIFVVEGSHDIQFLRRISRMLHAADPQVPDLAAWEQAGTLIFIPTGGGDLAAWSDRLAGLRLPEFHLYDREVFPETVQRQQAVERINQRPGCRAVLTRMRGTENYLHAAAIQEARGVVLAFGDEDDVPDLAARHCYRLRAEQVPWGHLPPRHRKRLRERAKHWLNRYAADCMTVERLAESDPTAEVRSWLMCLAELAGAFD